MAPTNFVCGHCGSDIASYVCFCTRPLTYLCLACTQGHKGKGVCKIRPITSEFDLEELAATFQEERRSSCFGQAKCCLRANEMKVKHYQNYVEDLKNSWLKEIEDWYDQKTKEMSEFEDCTMGLVEDLDSTIEEKEMRESPPRDMFEESIACLDPDSVDEVCKELSAVVQFQPVALSLGSVFAEVPDIVLTRPPTIGVKRLSVHFQGRTFPIYCKTDLPEELLFLIKQELHLDTNPTV